MGNFVFTCPSTNLNVQHWRGDDDEVVLDNEYEGVICKACATVALDQPKDRKSFGTRGRPHLLSSVRTGTGRWIG